MATTIADAYVQIIPSAEGVSGKLSTIMDDAAGTAGSQASGSFGSSFSAGIMKANLGTAAIKAVSSAAVDLGKSAVSAGMEWESSFAQVQTIMDTTQMSTEDMSSAIQDLSNEMGISANELSGTVYNAISATGDTANAVELAAQASQLATAGFTDTSSALSVLTTAMNAYGLSADEAESISDSLIQVQNLGVTTVSELSSSMGKAIASASAYGVDLTNLESAYVSMTKAGINTAESTTYISSMLKELGDSGSSVGSIIQEETGKSFAELMNEGSSLGDVLGILNDSVDGDATALMNLWSSAEAGKASNAIISQGLEEFNENLETIGNTAGSTQSAYDTMADTLEHKTDVFKTLGTNLMTTLYEGMSDDLGDFVDIGNDALSALSEGFTSGGIDGLMSALGTVMSDLVSEIIAKIPDIVSAGSELLSSFATGIISNLPLLAESAMTIVSNIASGIGDNLDQIIPTVTSIIIEITNTLVEHIDDLVSAGLTIFLGLVEGLISAIPIIVQNIPTLLSSIITSLTESASMIAEAGITLFSALTENLPTIIDSIVAAIPGIVDACVDFFTNGGCAQLLEAGYTLFVALISNLPAIISAIVSAIPQIVSSIVSAFTGRTGDMKSAGSELMTSVGDGLDSVVDSIKSSITSTVSGWVTGITSTVSSWKDAGSQLLTGLWNGISDKAQWVYNQITSMGSTIINKVKGIFGIASPSKVFAEIGGYMAEGLGTGWDEEMKEVQNDINGDLTFKTTFTASAQTAEPTNTLAGTKLTLYETIDLGDTKLKEIVSQYTLEKIGTETRAVKVAQGGFYGI